jgi:hypothetical protein
LLTEAGLAREVRFGDGRAHYEHNYKHQHHDHMICSECGKIIEFYSPELEAIQDAMAAKHRFELTEHLLRMIGICADCRKAKRRAKKTAGAREKSQECQLRFHMSNATIQIFTLAFALHSAAVAVRLSQQ